MSHPLRSLTRWFLFGLVLPAYAVTDLCDDCDDVGLSLRQLRGMKQASHWSFTNPDPERLVWDNMQEQDIPTTSGLYTAKVYNGWLKVPLVHDPALMEYEMPPEVCLRVRGMAALKQPAKNGPLLVHCGGPGSGRDCGLSMALSGDTDIDGKHDVISAFDLLSIDQRGVSLAAGDQLKFETNDTGGWGAVQPCPFKQSGRRIKPFPSVHCNEISQKLDNDKEKIMPLLVSGGEASADAWGTYVKPILDNGDMPSTDMAVFNETFARWYYRLVELEHGLCFQAPRYQLEAPNGRAYNALRFVGTVDLAHDLNVLRQAIGAEKMSLFGASYGTAVASVYASIFPSSTFRVVMDGVVDPMPDVAAQGDISATGLEDYWDGLLQDCRGSATSATRSKDQVCPAAPGAASKAMKVLLGKDKEKAAILYNLIDATIFPLQVGHSLEAMAPSLMACIEQFASGQKVAGCQSALDALFQVPEPERRRRLALATSSEDPVDRFNLAIQSAVMGTDTAGRLNEEEYITWWKRTKERAPIGVDLGKAWAVGISTWPAYARPVPPVGASGLKPVIIGNLHDPQTAYEGAQKMKKAFPDGYLVTWQGYGHCLQAEKLGSEILEDYEDSKAKHRLPTYTNALAKYACLAKILSYLETGEGVTDGHTCVMPEPLSLGSAAIEAHKAEFAVVTN